jgi:hypothetical protein
MNRNCFEKRSGSVFMLLSSEDEEAHFHKIYSKLANCHYPEHLTVS